MKTQTKAQKKLALAKKAKRVLAIGAHPDDTEWGCGGTLAKLKSEGAEIFVLLTTDGSKGSSNPKMTPKKMAEIRKKEHAKANKILGVKKAFYLDFEDGTLDSPLALRKDIVSVIRTVRPDIVFSFDPYSHEHNHPDHRVTGMASLDAIYPSARDRMSYPELLKQGLKPHKVQEVFMFFSDKPNVFVEIAKTIDIKVASLAAHTSQYPDKKELKNNLYSAARKAGLPHGTGFAEEFKHLKMPL